MLKICWKIFVKLNEAKGRVALSLLSFPEFFLVFKIVFFSPQIVIDICLFWMCNFDEFFLNVYFSSNLCIFLVQKFIHFMRCSWSETQKIPVVKRFFVATLILYCYQCYDDEKDKFFVASSKKRRDICEIWYKNVIFWVIIPFFRRTFVYFTKLDYFIAAMQIWQ